MEDKNGFVYEKNAIVSYIKKAGARRVRSPVAESNDFITLDELKPATRVLQQKKLNNTI